MTTPAEVLVTGAGGFVGYAVARELVRRGERVRVVLRKGSARGHLEGLGVDFAEADLRDPQAVAAAMRGIRRLYHVAADYRLWAPNPEEIVENNVSMTQTVMRAAAAAGVDRIGDTSSVATLKPGEIVQPGDEDRPLAPDAAVGAYKRSKVLAERLVERMAEGRIIVEALAGRMPAYVDTGLNLVHVDDVAAGHVLAMERGLPGRRYLLGGDNVPLSAFLAEIAERAGRAAPRFCLPYWSVYPVALGAEAVARLTGREPFVTRDGVKMAKARMYFTSARAEAELGYRPRPHAAGLDDAIAWFRANGYLR